MGSKFLGQSDYYEDSDGTTAAAVLNFTAYRNFKIASATLFNNNNNRNNKVKKSHMHSKLIPIYLDHNRMKTIHNFLFEYKNAF